MSFDVKCIYKSQSKINTIENVKRALIVTHVNSYLIDTIITLTKTNKTKPDKQTNKKQANNILNKCLNKVKHTLDNKS